MLESVPDIAQITHGTRNIFADIRNVPTGVPCVYFSPPMRARTSSSVISAPLFVKNCTQSQKPPWAAARSTH